MTRSSRSSKKTEPLDRLWNRWSISKLNMWLTCKLQFWFRYGLHQPDLPQMPRLLGEALHEMFEKFFTNNYKSRETFLGSWKTQWWRLTRQGMQKKYNVMDWPDPQSAGMFFGRGHKILAQFYEINMLFKEQGLIPLTEQAVIWPILGIILDARIDRLQPIAGIPNQYLILDYKTGFGHQQPPELLRNRQMTAYQLAHRHRFGTDPLGLEFHYLTRLLSEMKSVVKPRLNQFNQPWPWLVESTILRGDPEFNILLAELHQAQLEVKAKVVGVDNLETIFFQPPAAQTKEFQQALSQAGFLPTSGKHCSYCPYERICHDYKLPAHPDPQYYQDELLRAQQARAHQKAETPSLVFPRHKPKRRPKSLPTATPRGRTKKKGVDKTPDLFLAADTAAT